MAKAELGILMLEGKMADVPGCMAAEDTFPGYPVNRFVVPGSKTPFTADDALAMLPLYVTAAQQLEQQGVGVITANCGLMALMQDRIASTVRIPVVLSSMVAVPAISKMIAPGKHIGILTFYTDAVTERNYNACGWSSETHPVSIAGVGGYESWQEFLRTKEVSDELRPRLREDLRTVVQGLLKENPDIGALVAECTMLPTVLDDIRDELPVPVFDILTVLDWSVSGFSRPVTSEPREVRAAREAAATERAQATKSEELSHV
ncbi:hypothetical protein [Streptomyces sp. NBC_01262]|jgi:hypothetical protein|uniref:hypothetical protein n=1 Tax=Streptomyces sp. NBC_01262 TaxID=2903803 RepID=UPI002E37D2F9|nr:hypothetical protein [Streptomyces sp. NBC_01262]